MQSDNKCNKKKIKLDVLNTLFLSNYIEALKDAELDTFGCDDNDQPYDVIPMILDHFDISNVVEDTNT